MAKLSAPRIPQEQDADPWLVPAATSGYMEGRSGWERRRVSGDAGVEPGLLCLGCRGPRPEPCTGAMDVALPSSPKSLPGLVEPLSCGHLGRSLGADEQSTMLANTSQFISQWLA